MKALGEYTRMNPATRVDRLQRFAQRINETPASRDTLGQFNVNVDRELLRLPARVLKPELIVFGDQRTFAPDQKTADWTPALRNNQMYSNEECKRWILLYPRRARDDSQRFLKMMQEVAGPLGFVMANPKEIELVDDRTNTYRNEVVDACKKDPKFIMCVLMGKKNNLEKLIFIFKLI